MEYDYNRVRELNHGDILTLNIYTRKIVNYMTKKAKLFGLNSYSIGNVTITIDEDITTIKCNECGDTKLLFSREHQRLNPDLWYYKSGSSVDFYSYGNFDIGKDREGKLTVVCDNCLDRYDITTCEICGQFSMIKTSIRDLRPHNIHIKEFRDWLSRNERCIYLYNRETEDYEWKHFMCPDCLEAVKNETIDDEITYRKCSQCGIWFNWDDLHYCSADYDDNLYCSSCLDDRERELEEENYDDDYEENEGEWEDLNNEFIYEYHGKNHKAVDCGDKQMFGGEYEILCFDNANLQSYDDRWSFCNSLSKYGGITKDGSVDLEIVTPPMELNNLRNTILSIASICRNNYVQAWDKNKCGLHIHINRKGMSNFPGIYNFLRDNSDELFVLSGRTTDHCGYCKFEFPADEDELEEACDRYDRYLAINLNNSRTVEFRFFRNTTNEVRLNAYFDFLETLMKLQDDIEDYTWEEFITQTHNKFLYNMFNIDESLAEAA